MTTTSTPSTLTTVGAAKLLGVSPTSLRNAGNSAEGITLGGRVVRPVIIGTRQNWPAAPILAWLEGREAE